jgi:hypothetical protein
MPTHQEVRTWAREFRKAYGETLADHLKFWQKSLGINDERMLGILGFDPQDEGLMLMIRRRDWEAIAEVAGERGWFVDGLLLELLSRHSYNRHALAEELHGTTHHREKARSSRRTDSVETLPLVPPEGRHGILLNQVADGGPQALSALVEYLSDS